MSDLLQEINLIK